jgi:hypothetical protein
MTMKGGHIETSEMVVTELEGKIQQDLLGILKDHMIVIHLLQGEIGEVLAL